MKLWARLRTAFARWLFSRTNLYQNVELYTAHPRIRIRTMDGGWRGERGPDVRLNIDGWVGRRNVSIVYTLTKDDLAALDLQLREALAAQYLWEHG